MSHLPANEIVGTTFYTIDRILKSWKGWSDALALYFRYIEQSRIQWTNVTYSLDFFMMQKMWWSKTTFYNVKKILQWLWLIDTISKTSLDWKKESWYVRVNFIINEDKVRNSIIDYDIWTTVLENGSVDSTVLENQTPRKPDSQNLGHNTIVPNINAYIPNINTSDFDKFWNLYDKKIDKPSCFKKWNKLSEEDKTKCLAALPAYKQSKPDKQYRKNPETYLNNRWREDEIIPYIPKFTTLDPRSEAFKHKNGTRKTQEEVNAMTTKDLLWFDPFSDETTWN